MCSFFETLNTFGVSVGSNVLAITNASTDVPRAIEEEQSARNDMMARNGNGYHLAPRIQRRGRIERVARRDRMAADDHGILCQHEAMPWRVRRDLRNVPTG